MNAGIIERDQAVLREMQSPFDNKSNRATPLQSGFHGGPNFLQPESDKGRIHKIFES